MVLLAQLVDALPNWAWYVLLVAGMLVPILGLLLSTATKTATSAKRQAVTAFYLIAVPLEGLTVLGRTENPLVGCSFLILLPVGIILGIAVLMPRTRVPEQRGFEVQAKREDELK